MLSYPACGWCRVDVPGWRTDQASYLEDYPVTFAHALLGAAGIEHGWFEYPDEPESMASTAIVDCEGAGRFAVRFSEDAVTVFDDDPDFSESAIAGMPLVEGELSAMCHMLANDIEANKAGWISWDLYIPDPEDSSDGEVAALRAARERLLDEIVGDLRRA